MTKKRLVLIRAIVRAAVLQATATSSTAQAVLETLIASRFSSEISRGGKTVISTSSNGQAVSFQIIGIDPGDVLGLAEEALEWLLNQPDPENPRLNPRPIRGIRFSFRKASV